MELKYELELKAEFIFRVKSRAKNGVSNTS